MTSNDGLNGCVAWQVDDQMLSVQNKNSSYFVEWIPNNVKSRCFVVKAAYKHLAFANLSCPELLDWHSCLLHDCAPDLHLQAAY